MASRGVATACEPAEGDGVDEGLFAGEVAVDVAVAHVEGPGDVDDVGLLGTVTAQDGLGGIEDALGGGGFLRHGFMNTPYAIRGEDAHGKMTNDKLHKMSLAIP